MNNLILMFLDTIMAWLTAVSYLLAKSGEFTMKVPIVFLVFTTAFTLVLIVYIFMQDQNRPRPK